MNFDLAKQRAEESDKDWKFGAAALPSIVSIPESERELWLPVGETQFDSVTDFNDCASRSPVNHLEAVLSYHYFHLMKPDNQKWLSDNGYIKDNRVSLSDRYIAILSGTTKQGNSLKAPLDAIRLYGLIPKSLLPKEDWMTWEDYMDASKITSSLKNLGAEFLKRFTINYDQVPKAQIGDALEHDMVGVAGYAWNVPIDGVYHSKPTDPFSHAFLIYKRPKYQIYDNYYDFDATGKQIFGDFTKNLAPDYTLYDWGYRAFISGEMVPSDQEIERQVFAVLSANGLLSIFADWWQRFSTHVGGLIEKYGKDY